MIPKKSPSWYAGKQISIRTTDEVDTFDFDKWRMHRNLDGFVVFESFETGEIISISYDYILSAQVIEKKNKLLVVDGGKDERSSA